MNDVEDVSDEKEYDGGSRVKGKALNGHWILVNGVFSSFQTASLAHKRPLSERKLFNPETVLQWVTLQKHCLASLTKGSLFSSTDNAKKVLGGLEYRRQIM